MELNDKGRAWQRSAAAHWLALAIGIVPLYAVAILSGLQADASPLAEMGNPGAALLGTFLWVTVFGGLMAIGLYLVNGETLADLQLQPGTPLRDMGLAALGLIVLFTVLAILRPLLAAMSSDAIPAVNLEIGRKLAADPALAAVYLGPVVWLRAGILEELSRVYMLTRLWEIFPTPHEKFVILLISSVLFGAGHIWEGTAAVVATTAIGLVLGGLYYRYGRVLPLIVTHAVYDTLAFVGLMLVGSGAIKL